MKVEVDKLHIHKLVNVPTNLNNLKTKVHVSKLKTVPIHLKKLSDAVSKEILKNTKFNLLKTKGNELEKQIPDATTFIQIY